MLKWLKKDKESDITFKDSIVEIALKSGADSNIETISIDTDFVKKIHRYEFYPFFICSCISVLLILIGFSMLLFKFPRESLNLIKFSGNGLSLECSDGGIF